MNSPQLVSADGKPISQKMAAEWSLQKRGKQVSIVPHVQTFGSLQNWMSRTYRFSFDEAVRNNYDTAKSMPNDAFIQGLYRNRVTPVVKSDFRVISKGPGASEECNDFYKSMLLQIPYWHDFRRNVMKCAWSGRHGIQMAFDDMTAEGVPFKWNGKSARSISQWIPHLGDKITFTFDLMPCIRVSPLYMGQWKNDFGATILQPNDPRIVKEAVGYRWTEEGPVVVLDNMQVRKQFCISVFEIEDAPWDDPQLAGGIRGVGLRHYAFWNWNHMLEIQSWAMLHLEEFGVGGYTVVGYDGPEGLARAQATFEDREQHVLYVPVTPGTDERVTDMATRLEPSGTGNDAVFKWANDYFGNHLIVLFVGHPLNMQAGATGLNSDQGSHAKDILTSIHKSDAEILDNAMSYQVLTRLKEENDPEGTYTLEFESAIRAVDKDAGMTRIKAYFDMGGKVPGSLARMMADMGDKVEDGDTDYLQDQRYQQQAMQQSMMQAAPPPGSEDTSYLERGAEGQDSIGSIFRAGDAEGANPTGTTLAEARRKLEAKGVAPEDVLATLTQAVASGKLVEHDDEGGVSYSPGKGQVASYSTERNEVDPSANWSEEPAPRAAGGRRWRNINTGEVTYRQPSAGRHVQVGGDEHTADRLDRAQAEGVGVTPGKGVATAGIHARIMMLATEGGASLKGEGVLSEVHNVDKRLKKAEAVQLAGRLGLKVDSGTSKTAALAHIEHVLRLKQGGNASKPGEKSGKGDEKPGATMTGKESADPVGGTIAPPSPDSQLSPMGDNPDSASGDRPGDGASSPASPAESVSPTVSPDAPQATAGSTEEPRRPDEGVKDYLTRIGHKEVAKDVLGRAKALHKEEKYKVDAHNSVIKDAVETLSDMHGKNYRRNSPVWGKFEGDYTSIPGFDEMAEAVIAEYPGVFAAAGGQGEQAQEFGEHAGNVEKLWDMLKEGKLSYPDMRASEDRALQEAEEGNYDTGAIEEDTSFEYGANVEGENDGAATEGTSEAGTSLASGVDSNAGDAEGRTAALSATSAGDSARSADVRDQPDTATPGEVGDVEQPGQAGTEAGNSLSQAAEVSPGQAEALQTGEGSGDSAETTASPRHAKGGNAASDNQSQEGVADERGKASGVRQDSGEAGMPDRQGSGYPDGSTDSFMRQEEAGPHQAEDVPSYRGLSFTNSEGLTVDVKQDADGTWSVGSNTGLTQAGVANLLNKTKAEKARSLFGDEAQAQAEPAKPKEQLQWSKPTARKESGDLPGMRDAFAPGMFGQAASQADQPAATTPEKVSPTGDNAKVGAVDRIRYSEEVIDGDSPFTVMRGIDPQAIDHKPGDGSMQTAQHRSRPMVDALRQGGELPPLLLSEKEDGRYEVYDGNARTIAHKETGVPVTAILVDRNGKRIIREGESANGMGTEHTGRNGPGPVGVHAEQQPEHVDVDNERQLQPAEQPDEGGGSGTIQAGEGSGQAKAEGENKTQAIDLRDQAKAGVNWVRAPAGGKVSDVNGKHYAGGQLMPIHGLSEKKEYKPKSERPVQPRDDGRRMGEGRPKQARSPMTPEEIAAEKQRREDQSKWDSIRRGALGRVKGELDDEPGYGAMKSTGFNMRNWKEFAEEQGEDAIQDMAWKMEQAYHEQVDRWAEGRPADSKPLTKEDVDYAKNTPRRYAENSSTYHGMKKHLGKVPSSLIAKHLAEELLHETNNLDTWHEINRILSGEDFSPGK